MRRALVAALLTGVLVAAMPLGARADMFASGGISPSIYADEDRGHQYRFMHHLLGTAYSGRIRIGGEIELAKYDTELAGLPGIQVKSYNLRGLVEFVAFPNRLSPYWGGGVGVNVMRLDDDAIENVITTMEIDNFGIALGGFAFAGLQVPISRDVLLFTEFRIGAVFDVLDKADVQMGVLGLEGHSGITGLRMRF